MTASTDVKDLYKVYQLLQSLPPTFNRTKTSTFAKVLAACGERDNYIGGLFGKANFLGETSLLLSGAGTINAGTGLSLNSTNGQPPGPAVPTGDKLQLSGTTTWAGVMTTTALTTMSISIAVLAGAPAPNGITINDGQYWDTSLNAWASSPGNVGVIVGLGGGNVTVAQLEAAINATSKLLRVTTDDTTNASQTLLAQNPLVGPVDLSNVQDRSAIDQARDSMFVNTATGKYLTTIGNNYGVHRPPQSPFDDELFRRIIPILAWLPKTPLLVTYSLAQVIFGTQTLVQQQHGWPWQIYEVNPNEIIFECPIGLIAGNTEVAGYLHGYPGTTGAVTGPTNTITNVGSDARLAVSGGNLAGFTIYVYFSGAWQTYTISSSTYNAGTQTNTFVLSASTVPTGDSYPFFIDIPSANSWNPGDFMVNDATVAADGTNPPHSYLPYLFGKARLDIFEFYMNNFVRAAGVSLRSEIL